MKYKKSLLKMCKLKIQKKKSTVEKKDGKKLDLGPFDKKWPSSFSIYVCQILFQMVDVGNEHLLFPFLWEIDALFKDHPRTF